MANQRPVGDVPVLDTFATSSKVHHSAIMDTIPVACRGPRKARSD